MNKNTKNIIIDTKNNYNKEKTAIKIDNEKHYVYEYDCGAVELSELINRYKESMKYVKKDIVLK